MTGMTLTDRARAHRVSRVEFESYRDERERDGARYELLDGEILVTPSPVMVHQRVVTRLLVLLHPVVPAGHELLPAPFDVLLDVSEGDTTLQPDLLVARTEAWARRTSPRRRFSWSRSSPRPPGTETWA